MCEPYQYQKLEDRMGDSIRLLKLASAAQAEQNTIDAELEEISLCQQPKYIALSYTWKSPGLESQLRLRKHNGYGILSIRPNVNAVLGRLQRNLQPNETLFVWIDAICINQDDVHEKAKQVSRMRQVYLQASEVIVYLGDADEQTELALKAIRLLATTNEEPDMSDLSEVDSSDDRDSNDSDGENVQIDEDLDDCITDFDAGSDEDTNISNHDTVEDEESPWIIKQPNKRQADSRFESLRKGIKRRRVMENASHLLPPSKSSNFRKTTLHSRRADVDALRSHLHDTPDIDRRLREYVLNNVQLRHLDKVGTGHAAINADAIVDAFESRIRMQPHDDEEIEEEDGYRSRLGLPFGMQLCQDILDNKAQSTNGFGVEGEISDVPYQSLLCLAMLNAVSGESSLTNEANRVRYLDLAAEDKIIHNIRSEIVAPNTRSLVEITTEQLGKEACKILAELSPDSELQTTIQALVSIFDRPWFSRVWIQQEIVLAQNARVWIGEHTMRWEELFSADMFCFQNDLRFGKGIGTCAVLEGKRIMQDDDEEAAPDRTFIAHAAYARRVECTDPRDKVFGWLGLMREEHVREISAVYTISTAETYQRFAELLIHRHKSLEILALRFPHDSDEMPSWVPDLNGESNLDEAGLGNMRTIYPTFSAAGDSKVISRSSSVNPKLLELQGVFIDEIVATSVAFRQKEVLGRVALLRKNSIELVIGAWASMALAYCGQIYATQESITDAFWKTLIQHRGSNEIRFSTEDRYAALQTVIYHLKTNLPLPADVRTENLEGELLDEIRWRRSPETMLDYIAMQLGSLRFFVTKKGYVGVAYYNVQEKDRVVLFSGGRMPFLIRKVDVGYKLQSPSYIHGVMDGAMWRKHESSVESIDLI